VIHSSFIGLRLGQTVARDQLESSRRKQSVGPAVATLPSEDSQHYAQFGIWPGTCGPADSVLVSERLSRDQVFGTDGVVPWHWYLVFVISVRSVSAYLCFVKVKCSVEPLGIRRLGGMESPAPAISA
jgi:hypothetical protein